MNKVNGLLYGLLSSASFGLIPLFTIPAMQAGMQFESILFYRFLFACLALGGILLVNGQSFRIKRQDIPSLFLLALLYLMSAVFLFWGYALYLVTMSQLKIGQMKGLLLTFYVFLFGGILLFIGTETISQLQPISKWHTAGNLILLALIPTVVSNLALVRAVKSIGSTLTSVLGAMEPVTAVCVGIFLFGEAFTTSIGVGIALIIAAVIVIILKR